VTPANPGGAFVCEFELENLARFLLVLSSLKLPLLD
jgi:hypothetical protein